MNVIWRMSSTGYVWTDGNGPRARWTLVNIISGDVKYRLFYSILSHRHNLGRSSGHTHEFARIPFHLVLFSAALVELPKSSPVHSLTLSSHLFFCLPLFMSLASKKLREHIGFGPSVCPSVCPLRLLLVVRVYSVQKNKRIRIFFGRT